MRRTWWWWSESGVEGAGETESIDTRRGARRRALLTLPSIAALALLLATGCTPAAAPVVRAPAPAPAPVPVTPAPVARIPTEGAIHAAPDVDLWYRMVGSGADTVVVPLAVYLEQPLAALGSSHTVIFYDPRHRGRSGAYADTSLSTFDHDVEDVEAVRSHFGLARISLIGFSYFGAVVAQYAADHPEHVERVVMISPIEPNAQLEAAYQPAEAMARIDTVKARRLVRMRAEGRDTTDIVGYCRAFWEVNAPVYVGEAARATQLSTSFCDLPNEGVRAFGAHVGRVMGSLRSRRDFTPVAARIRAPVLVLYGDRDLVANPEGARTWSRLVGGARAEAVRGAGHMLYLDDHRRTILLLEAFLGGR